MKEETVEGYNLLLSVLKWIASASCIGVAIGIAAALILKILQTDISDAAAYPYYFCFLPFRLFLSAVMARIRPAAMSLADSGEINSEKFSGSGVDRQLQGGRAD
jgi:hypothetical protein